jgi:WD40 repeat protein
MVELFRYAAFISYSSKDASFAKRLHRALERYGVPTSLGSFDLVGGGKKNRIYPIFRDREEASAGRLGELIEASLKASAALVVVCSPNSAQSPWVEKEIQSFIAQGRQDRIFAIISDTAPLVDETGADATAACFPPAFSSDVLVDGNALQPLAADARKGKDGFRNAWLKIVAGLINVNAGALADRDRARRKSNAIRSGLIAATLLFAVGLGISWMVSIQMNARSNALAVLAQKASDDGDPERAFRYARAGLVGADWRLVAFKPHAAEMQLRRAVMALLAAGPPLRHNGWVNSVAFSPDGSRIATASNDHTAQLWDARTALPLGKPMRHDGDVVMVAFSPDGRRLATASKDGAARLWDGTSGAPASAPLRHKAAVIVVAFSPDGTRLGTASGDTASLWDAASGAPIGPPLLHDGAVNAIAFSPDGTLLATAASDDLVRVWDTTTAALHIAASRHEDRVNCVAFSPDGTRFASASDDHTARIWDARTGVQMGASLSHEKGVDVVAFSPDGTRVATASWDKTARLWDAQTGAPIGAKMDIQSDPWGIAFSPDGSQLATAASDAARLWDGRTGSPVAEPMRQQSAVSAVAFSPDGTRLATASFDHTARVWKTHGSWAQFTNLQHDAPVETVAFSRDGKRVVTGADLATVSERGTVRFWNSADGTRLEALTIGAFLPVALSPDGNSMAAISSDGSARLWDVRSGELVGSPMRHGDDANGSNSYIEAIAFSPDGSRIATGGSDSTLRVWDGRTGIAIGMPLRLQSHVTTVTFSPDGQRLAAGMDDFTAHLWDARTLSPIGPILRPSKEGEWQELARRLTHGVVFSPDGTRLATAMSDNTVRMWDAKTGAPVSAPMQHSKYITDITFSPDGTRLATASADNSAQLWDAKTGVSLGAMAHDGIVWALAFSPDGTRLTTASQDATVRLWDVKSAAPLGVATRHDADVYAVAFSPDGKSLATASRDHTARIWRLPAALLDPISTVETHACADVLRDEQSRFSDDEIKGAPFLDKDLDIDVCRPTEPTNLGYIRRY